MVQYSNAPEPVAYRCITPMPLRRHWKNASGRHPRRCFAALLLRRLIPKIHRIYEILASRLYNTKYSQTRLPMTAIQGCYSENTRNNAAERLAIRGQIRGNWTMRPSRWRTDALLQCRYSSIGTIHRDAAGPDEMRTATRRLARKAGAHRANTVNTMTITANGSQHG